MSTSQQSLNQTSARGEDNLDYISATACSRCGGLLVRTFCVSPDEGTADFQIPALRCLQCGDVIDSVILKNRFCLELPNPRPPKKVRYLPVQAISRF